VHQELAIFQDLSVGDNVFVGHLPSRSGMVETESLNRKTRSILDGFGDGGRSIDPSAIVGSLSVAQQQMVEIAKALSSECKVLIFDEPTSSLNESEADSLFEVIRGLAAQGIGIIYISHKMAEIFSLCDTITIMRDGRVQETVPVSERRPNTW
jgi:ABC-type sugar transport system ATPase subunit